MRNWLKQRGQDIRELGFITAIFTWVFNFLSRVAEPLMTLGVIYTIIVAGIPQAYNAAFAYTATAAMIGSPEIILPGAFILAFEERSKGNKQAWMLITVCCMFVCLTILTLADLFVFHFSTTGVNALMCVRCVTGVSYSIIVRIVNKHHGHGGSQGHGGSGGSGSQPPTPFDPDGFMREVQDMVNQALNQQRRELVESLQGSQEQTGRELASLQSTLKVLEQHVSLALSRSTTTGYSSPDNGLSAHQLRLISSGSRAGRVTGRQLVEALPAAPQATVETQDRSMLNSQANHDQTTYEVHGAPALNVTMTPGSKTDEVHAVIPEQTVNRAEVHNAAPTGQFMNPGALTRVSREQVIAFVVNYWTTNGSRPKLQVVMEKTGCSKGQASACVNQVAPRFGGSVVTED